MLPILTANVFCRTCKISSPREVSELSRPSGQICLICGSPLIDADPWPIIGMKDENVPEGG